MRSVDDWTPGVGWRVAMARTAVRGGIGAVVAGAVVYFMYPYSAAMSAFLSMVIVTAVSFGAVGFLAAFPVVHRMEEVTGLAGRTLFLPVMGLLLAMVLAAMLAAVGVRGWQWSLGLTALVAGIASWVFLTCFVFLLML